MSKVIAIVSILLPALLTSEAVIARQQKLVKVQGVLVDPNDARVVGATIILESRRLKRVVNSDEAGAFSFDVPTGSYQLIVAELGFETFEMKRLEVTVNGVNGMKIGLKPEPFVSVLSGCWRITCIIPPDWPIKAERAPLAQEIVPRKIQ